MSKEVIVTIRMKPVEEDALLVTVYVEAPDLVQYPTEWVGDYQGHCVTIEVAGKQRTLTLGRVEPAIEIQGSEQL